MSSFELCHPKWGYRQGLHDLGRGVYAWLQPDGSWGLSNAGLIIDGDASLLVDTLFDLPLTDAMLRAMRDAEPRAAKEIDTLVNTHANGDHCFGNQLVRGAEIIASRAAAQEMSELPPAALAQMVKAFGAQPGAVGQWTRDSFGRFVFEGITLTLPTRTFERELELRVGAKRVELIEVGPAHTRGDILVHVPDEGIVFTGDILFIESTPIVWEGPVSNWIAACERIRSLGASIIVPGHGPVTDRRGVLAVEEYLTYVRDQALERYRAGMSAATAARDIELGKFRSWSDAERIAVNVATFYREFGDERPRELGELFVQMAALASDLR